MKVIKLISMMLLFGLAPVINYTVYAQDPVVVAPNVYKKVLINNDKARVIQIELAPGESTPWHSHPDHIAYALTDGKIEITDKDKPGVVYDIKAGDAMYLPAVTHMAKNLGTTPIKMVVTEIKHPGNKMKTTKAPVKK